MTYCNFYVWSICVSRLLRSYTKMNASLKETLPLLVRKHLYVPFLPTIRDADILYTRTRLECVCVRLCRWEGESSESMAVRVTHIGIQSRDCMRCHFLTIIQMTDALHVFTFSLSSSGLLPGPLLIILCVCVCECVAVWMKDLPSPSEEREPSCWHSAE